MTDANGLDRHGERRGRRRAARAAAPAPPARPRGSVGTRIDVASEGIGSSQGLQHRGQHRDFRNEMDDVSTIGFSWEDDDVFESDFVDPSLAATTPAGPTTST